MRQFLTGDDVTWFANKPTRIVFHLVNRALAAVQAIFPTKLYDYLAEMSPPEDHNDGENSSLEKSKNSGDFANLGGLFTCIQFQQFVAIFLRRRQKERVERQIIMRPGRSLIWQYRTNNAICNNLSI